MVDYVLYICAFLAANFSIHGNISTISAQWFIRYSSRNPTWLQRGQEKISICSGDALSSSMLYDADINRIISYNPSSFQG
jgi:hypothetical protein